MKILVTGSNGLLGQKLVQKLKADDSVELIATARGENRLIDQRGYTYRTLDITDEAQVTSVIKNIKPDVVINTAAMTNVDACEQDKEGCDLLNISAVEYLVKACADINAHLVHLSTDFIFDGENGPYREEDEAAPISYYGESKLKAEQIIREKAIGWTILRTVLVYGVAEAMSRSNIVLWAKGALEKGQSINVVDDQFRTATLAEDLADGCILAAKQKAQGIYNISGDEYMSIIDLVRAVGDFWKLDTSLISPVSSTTLSQPAKRPPKTGFILDKARQELGYSPHTFVEGLELVNSQLKN